MPDTARQVPDEPADFGIRTVFPSALFLAGAAAIIMLIALFRYVDWDQGILRGFLLVVLGALMFGLHQAGNRFKISIRAAGKTRALLTVITIVAFCVCLATVFTSIRRTAAGGEILLDQGQVSYRALRFMEQHINPYGQKILLDPIEYIAVHTRIAESSACLVSPVGDFYAELYHYWQTLDVKRAADKLLFVLKNDPDCRRWLISTDSLGYKYGPVLLASYWPFVKLWDKAGIYISHLTIFGLFVMGLLFVGWRRYDRKAGIFLLPVIMLLVPFPVRYNTLHFSASDLLPTATAVAAALCLIDKRFGAGAILLALSIGTKPLPGLLYLPLMLGVRPRYWFLLAGLSLLIYAPVFAWDMQGAVNNLVLFNFLRGTDSTALLHYLPATIQPALPILALTGIGGLAFRAHRNRWNPAVTFEYLIGAHLLLFASGKIFHNNYLVWIMPLLGLALAEWYSHWSASNHKETSSSPFTIS